MSAAPLLCFHRSGRGAMAETVALIGFGEAGHGLGRGLAAEDGVAVQTYDIKFPTPEGARMRTKAHEAGVLPHDTLASALAGAGIVLSAVVASEAAKAAAAAAP